MVSLGLTWAQDTTISIHIPVLLKLSLDNQEIGNQSEVPLIIKVKDGVYEISPEQTRVKVISNTVWQLNIQTQQKTSRNQAIELRYRIDKSDDWRQTRSYAQSVRQGRGLVDSEMTIHYGLNTVPFDGLYEVVVFYTLSNP
jgi:hypothetical protein